MEAIIFDINGKEKEKIKLPKEFAQKVREDIIVKVLESKKYKQPYSPSLVAGKQHSASGKLSHRRHVWKSQYGRGWSRIPRKVMTRKGSQFNFVGAEVSNTRGGRRPHPPKILSMMNIKKINKKESKIALVSALSATADGKMVVKRYGRLNGKKIKSLPLIVESKIVSLKTKELFSSLQKILGKDLFEVAIKKKSIRSGKGKMRGRKYKSSAGILLTIGNKEKLKVKGIDIVNANKLGTSDLAKGGLGRLTLFTEQAIKDLEVKLK